MAAESGQPAGVGELKPGRPCPLCGSLEHPWAGSDRETGPDQGGPRPGPPGQLAEAERAAALEEEISRRAETFRRALAEAGPHSPGSADPGFSSAEVNALIAPLQYRVIIPP